MRKVACEKSLGLPSIKREEFRLTRFVTFVEGYFDAKSPGPKLDRKRDIRSHKMSRQRAAFCSSFRSLLPSSFPFFRDSRKELTRSSKTSPQVPGNLWVEAWREAGFTPARRQKRLFDETAEAEKVFRYLDELTPGQLCFALLPNVLAESLRELHRAYDPDRGPSDLPALLEALLERAGRATRSMDEGPARFEEVLRRVAHAEVRLARASSLAEKLAPQGEPELLAFVREALSSAPEVVVVGGSQGPVGASLQRLMAEGREEGEAVLSQPSGKEYLLRTELSVPGPGSRVGPQRLFCAVQKDDCRLCGAFSRDTMFY